MLSSPIFRRSTGLLFGLLLATACTDPYLPEALQAPPSYLVVDGFLNARGSTTIKLSRTYAVGAKTPPPVEVRASVYLEQEGGPATLLREAPAGTYTSPTALALDAARRYRLHLTTLGGKEYASDFVPVKITPPIDNLSWQADSTGLRIRLNARDPSNATRFYRWDYVETWEINPIYMPQVEFKAGILNLPDITVLFPTKCWGTALSTSVLLTNTTPLSQDAVTDRLIRQLPPTFERLHNGYSMLVQQQGLTKDEFAYWELLRKNTESIGSLFDAQPVQLTGNVHCLNSPTEPVLGFVGAHSVVEKRLFVARRELPAAWLTPDGYATCYPPDTLWLDAKNPVNNLASMQSYFGNGANIPIQKEVKSVNNAPVFGYSAQSRDCIDCRTRGTSVKPSFWP